MEIRTPSVDERRDFVPILTAQGIPETAEDKFRKKLAEEKLKATQKGLPFAGVVAMDEFNSYYKSQKEEQMRKFGYIAEEIKPLKVDWAKYSDLKNFDVLEESERVDEQLSKRTNKQIFLKYKVYQFKGFYHRYTVMEDGQAAIKRIEEEESEKKSKRAK